MNWQGETQIKTIINDEIRWSSKDLRKKMRTISISVKPGIFDIDICHFDSLKIFSVFMGIGWGRSAKCDCINHFRRPRNVVRKPEEAGKGR